MRVVHVITRLIVGGAQENTLFTVQGLRERWGDTVTLITGPSEGPEGDLTARARDEGVDLQVVEELCRPIRPLTDWRAYRRLCRLIETLRPDVIHTHSSKAGIVGRAAAARCRVPAIVHTIHGLALGTAEGWIRNQVYLAAERWAASRTHRFISVADAMTREAVAAGLGPPARFTTIYSGMDVDAFLHPRREPASVRRELGLADADLVITKVARLFERKGHDDLIDIAPSLIESWRQGSDRSGGTIRFLMVGGGAWRDRLESRVARAGLGEHFRFTGLLPPEQIPEILAASDLVVHASYQEGLARVLPQALISGKPVVAYDVGGAREVVLDGRTGCLVPTGDRSGLARAILALARDPQRRQAYGQLGRELFADRFRRETMVERIRAVYEEILASPQKIPPRK